MSALLKFVGKKYKKVKTAGSTTVDPDCFSKFLHLTQSIPVREDIALDTPGSYINTINQGISKSFEEVNALQQQVYQTYKEEGEFVAFDDWSLLENTGNSTDFLLFNSPMGASSKISKKVSRDDSKGASENASKECKVCHVDCQCCTKSLPAQKNSSRLGNIDVTYSVNLAVKFLEIAKSHDDKNELNDACIFYGLAFHLSKLLNEEAYLSFDQKSMLLIGNYNIFRILCYLYPAQVAQRKTEWEKYNVLKEAEDKIELNLPPIPTDKNDVEALAMRRVIENATFIKSKESLSQVIVQNVALNRISINLSVPMNTIVGERKCRSLLLYGPPGNGKTLLAQAVASCKGMTFISMDISQIQSKWRGMTDATIRTLFKVASENTPSIVFMDEIESILAKRSDTEVESNSSTVATLLVESQRYAGVFFIGAANKPWVIDPAFNIRMARIYVKMPTEDERFEFLRRKFLNVITMLTTDNLRDLATATKGFSFDDLNNIIERVLDVNEISSLTSEFLKETYKNTNGVEQFCACKPNDPKATKISTLNCQGKIVNVLPITLWEILDTIRQCPPTIDAGNLKMYEKFAKDPMNGFKDFLDKHKLDK